MAATSAFVGPPDRTRLMASLANHIRTVFLMATIFALVSVLIVVIDIAMKSLNWKPAMRGRHFAAFKEKM